MAYSPEYSQRIANIEAQIAEIELLRTRQGNMPPPPKLPGKNASKEELQQYVTDLDAYEAGVATARNTDYQLDVLQGEKRLSQAQAAQDSAYTRASNAIGRTKQGVGRRLGSANKWASHIPTPGGVWVPFLILMTLFLVLFPVNGHTRVKWLFLVILGQAILPGDYALSGDRGDVRPYQSSSNSGNMPVLYDQNTNPTQSPKQIVTSLPSPPTLPTLLPLNVTLNENGSTGYLDSLFSIGF